MDQKPARQGLHSDFLGSTEHPAGIGPEIIRTALDSGKLDPRFRYRLIGNAAGAVPGQPTRETARAAVEALEEAARLALAGEIDAVATGPIHKAYSQAVGFGFPGQTEFFAARAGIQNFAMLLTGGALTVALVTTHVALSDVPRLVTGPEIERVGSLLAEFLRLRLGTQTPVRIAVAGLNPHAGESGAMGREEIDIIAPATAKLAEQWNGRASFTGPISPDTLFFRAVAGEFDGVLCMFHDQGLIPLKLHAFDKGVNVTLGLPFVRTSPDHGTAFEIAGRGIARADSTIAALQLAAELVSSRRK